MGIPSDGSYRIPDGAICDAPVVCVDGKYERVTGLPIDAFARSMIDSTCAELSEELAAATI